VGEWALAATVAAAVVALLTLGHRVVSQLLARIDGMGALLAHDMAARFDSAEKYRAEAAVGYRAACDERHRMVGERIRAQAEEIQELRREHREHRAQIADGYVSRATWLEHVGSTNIKLDKLLDELRGHIGKAND
jgi:hypothetical protein